MVHRAASACAASGNPQMAYLVFEPSLDTKMASIPQIKADLKCLWNLLGSPKGFPFYLVEVHMSLMAAFYKIKLLPKGNKATAEKVRTVLRGSGQLFCFEKYCITKVGEQS
jgi:hypothetical protein